MHQALVLSALLVAISSFASCLQAAGAQQQVAAAISNVVAPKVDLSSPLTKLIKADKPLQANKKQATLAKKAKTDTKTSKLTLDDQSVANGQLELLLKRPKSVGADKVESTVLKPSVLASDLPQGQEQFQHGQQLKFGLTNYDDNLPADSPISKRQSSAEQRKTIAEDKLGILKLSIFSTNNHMGDKRPPKFGSEEEY